MEALLGSTTKLGEVIVLGMITQLKEVCVLLYMMVSLESKIVHDFKSLDLKYLVEYCIQQRLILFFLSGQVFS